MVKEIDKSNVMRGPIPYLVMSGRAAEAMDLYAAAFGGVDLGR